MRKRTRRKVYASEDTNPVLVALMGASMVDEESLNKLRFGELSAIESITKGDGTLWEYRLLADMLNICERMAENGIGPEALPACEAFNDELASMAERYEKTGKMGFTGRGLQLAREVYEYHDIQRSSITRTEYERMIKKTNDYIRSNGHRVVNLK
jgi:hypothetical protein